MHTSRLHSDLLERQLRQAIHELGQHLAARKSSRAEEWLQRYPALAEDEELALELIYSEYVAREAMGERVSREEYFDRFAQLKPKLQKLFEVDAALHAEPSSQRTWVNALDAHVSESGLKFDSSKAAIVLDAKLPLPLGDFVLQEKLGSGGMGVVYRAEQISLRRQVALKVIREEIAADPETRTRFLREARIVAQLEHPHVVRIHEAGERDGRLYLALEYLPRGSLRNHMQGKPLSPIQAATLLEPLAGAMHFAHEQGIVHRDLKPGNILLAEKPTVGDRSCLSDTELTAGFDQPSNETGHPSLTNMFPKITDFGLASEQGARTQITQTGRVVGTPCYMAPEQARGQSGWSTPGVDIYALGAILYETLVGRPPFMSDSDLETLRLVAEADPVPPSRLHPRIPKDLETICLCCLQKEPGKRYLTAKLLAEDLQRFLRHEPIRAHPTGFLERGRKWVRRHPVRSSLLGVCFAATLAIAAIVGIYTHQLAQALAESNQQRLLAIKNAELAVQAAEAEVLRRNQAREALDALCSQLVEDWLTAAPQLERHHREFLENALRQYEAFARDVGDDEASRAGVARAYLSIAGIHAVLGRFDLAARAADRGAALMKELTAAYPAKPEHLYRYGVCVHRRAIAMIALGRWTEADSLFQESNRQWRLLVEQRPDAAEYLNSLARGTANHAILLQRQGRLLEAEKACLESIAMAERLLRQFPQQKNYLRTRCQGLANLAVLQRFLKRPQALQTHKEALEANRRMLVADPHSTENRFEYAQCHMNLALMLRINRDIAEAERLLRNGSRILERLREDRPNVPTYRHEWAKVRNALGLVLDAQKKSREAQTAHQEALKELDRLVNEDPKNPEYRTSQAGVLCDFAVFLKNHGFHQAAQEHFKKSLKLLQSMLQEEPQHYGARSFLFAAFRGLSDSLEAQKRFEEMAQVWREAEAWCQDTQRIGIRIDRLIAETLAGNREQAEMLLQNMPPGKLQAADRYNLGLVHAMLAVAPDAWTVIRHSLRAKAYLTSQEVEPLWKTPTYRDHLLKSRYWAGIRGQQWFLDLVEKIQQAMMTTAQRQDHFFGFVAVEEKKYSGPRSISLNGTSGSMNTAPGVVEAVANKYDRFAREGYKSSEGL